MNSYGIAKLNLQTGVETHIPTAGRFTRQIDAKRKAREMNHQRPASMLVRIKYVVIQF